MTRTTAIEAKRLATVRAIPRKMTTLSTIEALVGWRTTAAAHWRTTTTAAVAVVARWRAVARWRTVSWRTISWRTIARWRTSVIATIATAIIATTTTTTATAAATTTTARRGRLGDLYRNTRTVQVTTIEFTNRIFGITSIFKLLGDHQKKTTEKISARRRNENVSVLNIQQRQSQASKQHREGGQNDQTCLPNGKKKKKKKKKKKRTKKHHTNTTQTTIKIY
jgi:hypothetical protein